MRLTGIITQGASRLGTAEYIKAFKVASSLDGNSYITYKVDGQQRDKVRHNFVLHMLFSIVFKVDLLSFFSFSNT